VGLMASEGDLNDVARISLNQTGDLMVSTLPNGFAVMDSFPRKLRFHRQGVGHLKAVKLKGTSNLVAFVKRDEPRSVVLFDQRRGRAIGELTTSDTDDVDAFEWGDRIIATISRAGAVAVYDLSDLRLEHTFASAHAHADEVLAVNTSTVAYPDAVIGSIRIYDSATATTKTIRAHEHAIACSCLSPDGQKIATASTKGEYRPRLVRPPARISHSRPAPRAPRLAPRASRFSRQVRSYGYTQYLPATEREPWNSGGARRRRACTPLQCPTTLPLLCWRCPAILGRCTCLRSTTSNRRDWAWG